MSAPSDRPSIAVTRRQALAGLAIAGAAVALGARRARAAGGLSATLDFSRLPDGDGWPGWTTTGVANVLRASGQGLLEAGSDVYPNDPRPVAFAIDSRFRDGRVSAVLARTGYAPGVVVRRAGPRAYYAAIHDSEAATLAIVRRTGDDLATLASVPAVVRAAPATLTVEAAGAGPTRLTATLADALGAVAQVAASDGTSELQGAGDPGVLATAQTFLTTGTGVTPAFGNFRLAFFGTEEGEAVEGSPVGETYLSTIRDRSTAALVRIDVSSAEAPGRTPASVVAATAGVPVAGGARVGVATDLHADVRIDVSSRPDMRRARTVRLGSTGAFSGVIGRVAGLAPGQTVHWRARVRRGGLERTSPVRSFRVLPPAGDRRAVRLAFGACASELGPIFGFLAERRPDVFVWQGDLNYADTNGPLAQTMSGYAGMWRDLLTCPPLRPILDRALFATQRDDHDYAAQDANSTLLPPWGIAPWEALMNDQQYYRFTAGLAEIWVLDERRHKSDPTLPDTTAKTLLGVPQRDWLLQTLAASRAPFKVICSPCTLFYGDNARDGNWGTGFTAERDLVLAHIAKHVSGRTIFLTGDAHDTMVYDRDGVFEARACPLDIPDPRDHPGVEGGMFGGAGVVYASISSHFTVLDVHGTGRTGTMALSLVREDGATPYTKTFTQPLPPPQRRASRRRPRRPAAPRRRPRRPSRRRRAARRRPGFTG